MEHFSLFLFDKLMKKKNPAIMVLDFKNITKLTDRESIIIRGAYLLKHSCDKLE